VLRSGLAHLTRGCFRVFTLPKVAFLIGMALAALNIMTVEQEWRANNVEVVEHDHEDFNDELDDGVYAGRSGGEDDAGDVEEVASLPPP